jgi:exodeoxyribonuclease VII large subunit
MTPLSVSSLNEQIKNLLETTFARVYVEGEVSRVTYHNSGHLYFTLKDDISAVSCVMFRSHAAHLKFRLEEGQSVVLQGDLSVYKPRGQYQINATSMEPSGHGALALAYEQLKKRLSAAGYFDTSRKKSLPKMPRSIALITSETGAALQDMQRVAAQRWPLTKLYIYDAIVQGAQAAPSIVRAIKLADAASHDILVVGRGGGSMEDLWAFNEEVVAEALFQATTPTVSAVGHEIDWVISDFVADLRAPTPSAAMQMILPDQYEMLQSLDVMSEHYWQLMHQRLQRAEREILQLDKQLRQYSMDAKWQQHSTILDEISERLQRAINFRMEHLAAKLPPLRETFGYAIDQSLSQKVQALTSLQYTLANSDPSKQAKAGFAQISQDAKVIELSALVVGDKFVAMDSKVKVEATVNATEPMTLP